MSATRNSGEQPLGETAEVLTFAIAGQQYCIELA